MLPQKRSPPSSYRLDAQLVATHAAGQVVCLAAAGLGRQYALYASYPGRELNRPIARADIVGHDGAVVEAPGVVEDVALVRVDIRGPLLQRAGAPGPCEGYLDGYDAVTERLCAALAEGDVVLVMDGPGGAVSGVQECVRRILEAKEQYARKIYGVADEMIGSALFWIAACVCDELYGPRAMIVGSIGARAAHESIAGELAAAGKEWTFAAWPDEGKIAGVAELPLSDEGRARMSAFVNEAGEAFAAAVGAARGLSRDDIVGLHANALTGLAAVKAGLVDGIASLEDVMRYALAKAAGAGEDEMTLKATQEQGGATKASADMAPDKCGKCGTIGTEGARFCARCGDPMPGSDAVKSEKPTDEEKGPDSEDARLAAKSTASIAEIVGMRQGSSDVAVRAVIIGLVRVVDFAAKLTGASAPLQIVGGLKALHEDASRTAKMERDLKTERAAADRRERWDLCVKLAAANVPGRERGRIFVDDFDPTTHARTGMHLAAEYEEGTGLALPTLRGLVTGLTAGRAPERDPFKPDEKRAEEAAGAAKSGKPSQAAIDAAKINPTVIAAYNRSGNNMSMEQLAEAHARAFPQSGV